MQEFDEKWMAARAWYAAGRMIDWKCPNCGATSIDIADKCRAPLDAPCPGFQRTEEAYQEFARNWSLLVNT